MDVLSASCYSLSLEENERAILEQHRQEEEFNEMLTSCKSLSYYDSKKFKTLLPQIMASMIVCSFGIIFGLSMAYSAIIIPQLVEQAKNSTDAIQVTESDNSWIASVIVIIVPVGSIGCGFMMDAIGRLNMIKIAVIPNTIGWIVIATATNIPMIIFGRLLTGIAAAWVTSPSVVYVTEIARADMRGSLISAAPAFASLGMVLIYLKGWFWDWRVVAWSCNAYTIIPIILIMFIPESPPWLVTKGRLKEARKSLEWMSKYQPQPEFKMETFAEMQLNALQKEHFIKMQQHAAMKGNNIRKMFQMFLQPTGYKPLLILTGLFFFQQFSGCYLTLFYAITFFEDVGTSIDPYLASIFLGVVRLAMSSLNTWLMNRFTRRSLLTASALGMASSMAISGLFTDWIHKGTTNQSWVPVLMLVIFVITAMAGLLSIPWTIIAELFPIAIRGVAHAISYSIANLIMFGAIQSYYKLDRAFGGSSGLQYFFAIISLGSLVYSYVFLPETHRKKLIEIEEYFLHNTTYLGSKKKQQYQKRHQRKPIVRNSKLQTDFIRIQNEQSKITEEEVV